MWVAGSALLVVWFILKFVFHKGGFVHILLLTGISILVIQLVAHRKARYVNRRPMKRPRARTSDSAAHEPAGDFWLCWRRDGTRGCDRAAAPGVRAIRARR